MRAFVASLAGVAVVLCSCGGRSADEPIGARAEPAESLPAVVPELADEPDLFLGVGRMDMDAAAARLPRLDIRSPGAPIVGRWADGEELVVAVVSDSPMSSAPLVCAIHSRSGGEVGRACADPLEVGGLLSFGIVSATGRDVNVAIADDSVDLTGRGCDGDDAMVPGTQRGGFSYVTCSGVDAEILAVLDGVSLVFAL
jgi:hypothetical protein